MADSADPDQLSSLEANWSGSTLFAKQDIYRFSRTRVKYGKCPKLLNTLFYYYYYFFFFLPIFFFFFFFSMQLFHKIFSGMANSLDPDQTAPRGAVWSRSALFAYAILSETLMHQIKNRIIVFYRMYEWREKKCGLYFAHAQNDHNFCILGMFKDTFFFLDVHLGYNKEQGEKILY